MSLSFGNIIIKIAFLTQFFVCLTYYCSWFSMLIYKRLFGVTLQNFLFIHLWIMLAIV